MVELSYFTNATLQLIEMESSSSQGSSKTPLPAYEVAIWCTVRGEDEEEVKELVYKYCQQLKDFFGTSLVVKAIEVGLTIQPR